MRAELLAAALIAFASPMQAQHHLTADSAHFSLDGKPFQIISGEMHYARVPRELWRDRMKKAKAMGLHDFHVRVLEPA